MYIGRTIKAILDERASSRANGSVSTRHFHRFSFTRLNSIGSSRKSVEPVLTRYLTRSAPVSYKIPYVISARRRRTSSPSDGRCASRGRLSSRKKKKKKKRNSWRDELMLLPAGSKLVHVRSLYRSPPPNNVGQQRGGRAVENQAAFVESTF